MNALTTLALALALAQAPGSAPAPSAPSAPPAARAAATPPAESSQPPAPAGPVLTLDEALAIAETQNLDLKAAQARLRQADELSWKAWSGYLPQLTATGAYTHNQVEAVIPAGSLGTGSPEVTVQAQDQLAGQLEATQAILAPQLLFAIPNASRGERIAGLDLEGARREVLFGVAQAYYGAASLQRAREVSERLLEIAARQEKDARVRYQAGTIAKVGLLRAEIDRARAEQDLKRSQNAFASARIALATLLDRPPAFEVVDPPEPVLAAEAAAMEEAALRDRTDVQAARLNVDLQRGGRNQALSRYLPNLGAFGRYQLANEAGFTGQKDSWAVGLVAAVADHRRRPARVGRPRGGREDRRGPRDRARAPSSGRARRSSRPGSTSTARGRTPGRPGSSAISPRRTSGWSTSPTAPGLPPRSSRPTPPRSSATPSWARSPRRSNAQLAALRVLRAAGAFHPTRR